MSGKSTFLKTLGVNMILGFTGAPICGEQLALTPFRLYSCLRVDDSITEGFSFFYAEVRRLKALLSAVEERENTPVFFIIDEIFRGTNNKERLIGSRAYIQALAGKEGIGCVSTHDLELVTLADHAHQVTNYHFREHIVDGKMVFDYKLQTGPCPTTNALEIMRLEGLPVSSGIE